MLIYFQVDFPYLQKYKNEIQNCLAIVVEMPYQYGMLADVKEWGNLCIQDFENEYTSGIRIFSIQKQPGYKRACLLLGLIII